MSEIEPVKASELAGLSLDDALALINGEDRSISPKAPTIPAKITDAQKVALSRIIDLYGRVVPTEDRALTDEELATIVEERVIIDEILGFLTKRKNDSLRETLANHLDAQAPLVAGGAHEIPTDSRGHFALKQDCPVPGTGRKIQRTVSGGKPKLSIDGVRRALDEGKIDEDTFLSITRQPPRALSEEALADAVKADPSLLFILAEYSENSPVTTTIKVAKDG